MAVVVELEVEALSTMKTINLIDVLEALAVEALIKVEQVVKEV